MKKFETLDVRADERGCVTVTLNRPEARNALSARMIAELHEAAETLGASGETRVMVLAGAGAVFCAGGDLNWMREAAAAGRKTRKAEARRLAMMLKALNEIPAPLIARVHGGAYGGGVGLACVCDSAVAARSAKFGLTETRLGLIPATIGPYVAARAGEGALRRMAPAARIFSADEMKDMGVIARTAEDDDLDAAVADEIAPYFSVAPGAAAAAKAQARALGPAIDAAVIEDSINRLADVWETEEAAHGIAAFLDKKPPRWKE